MDLIDIIRERKRDRPLWDGQYKIPWDDPEFSRRMLEMHLSQEHDWASRKLTSIDSHVEYLHREILGKKPARILDLGCGPGLYAQRLAALGHTCYGIDFAPASIEHARKHTSYPERCEFAQGDIRQVDYGEGYDLAVMIYGEFNAFSPPEIEHILSKVHCSLRSGGRFLAEVHTFEAIERYGNEKNSWQSAESGLFSDKPHLCLTLNRWHDDEQTAEAEYFAIEAETGGVDYYRNTLRAYSPEEYLELTARDGFTSSKILPPWGKPATEEDDSFILLLAFKP